jgi:predicted RNA-binding protein with PIN domain
VTRWLVDASNVIGSRPDGWWRDRAGARDRLLDALRRFAAGSGDEVVVVLDSGPSALAGRNGPMEVAIAPRRGRDAADDEIVARLSRDADPGSVTVVTSDGGLAARVRELGASVEGARSFRDRLESH